MPRNNFPVLFLFLVFVFNGFLFGQQPGVEVYKILGIAVEGQRSVEPAAIIANAGLRVGGDIAIPSEETRTIIKRLHNLRLFEDVQIFIEKKIKKIFSNTGLMHYNIIDVEKTINHSESRP